MDLRPVMSHDDEPNLTILFNIWEISEGWSFYGSMVSIDIFDKTYKIKVIHQYGHFSIVSLCQKRVSDSNYTHGITLRSS